MERFYQSESRLIGIALLVMVERETGTSFKREKGGNSGKGGSENRREGLSRLHGCVPRAREGVAPAEPRRVATKGDSD